MPVEQAHEFADEVGEQATLAVVEAETGAAGHCQSGNLSLATGVIHDWLDGTLRSRGWLAWNCSNRGWALAVSSKRSHTTMTISCGTA